VDFFSEKLSIEMVTDKRIRKVILDIAERIKKNYNPEKIILFGSYAYGKPTRDSDIDMLIVKETKKRSMDRWFTLKKLCQDPNRGIPFSPLVFTPKELDYRLSLGDQFIKDILGKGQILYEREQ
jgi:predicted nucleotidyltransferase